MRTDTETVFYRQTEMCGPCATLLRERG
jgi:hypothetical protein